MTVTDVLIALCLIGGILFQIWVTLRVWRSGLYEREQKVSQSKLIWLVPLLGAAICFSVLQQEEKAAASVHRVDR